jgi:hypothetical protein
LALNHRVELATVVPCIAIGVLARQKGKGRMEGGGDECVEIMEVDSPENESTTSKTVTAGQVTEIKKSHHNLPW